MCFTNARAKKARTAVNFILIGWYVGVDGDGGGCEVKGLGFLDYLGGW